MSYSHTMLPGGARKEFRNELLFLLYAWKWVLYSFPRFASKLPCKSFLISHYRSENTPLFRIEILFMSRSVETRFRRGWTFSIIGLISWPCCVVYVNASRALCVFLRIPGDLHCEPWSSDRRPRTSMRLRKTGSRAVHITAQHFNSPIPFSQISLQCVW